MIPNAFLSGSRLLICSCVFVLTSLGVQGQGARKGPPGIQGFLDTQWWLGIRSGTVFTHPVVNTSNHVFSPIDYQLSDREKEYDSWGGPGLTVGIDIIFYHKGFSLGLQPGYKKLEYGYRQQHGWENEDGTSALNSRLTIEQDLHILEVPLLVKYEIIQSGKVRPFVQIGGQLSVPMDAQQEARLTHEDFVGAEPQEYVSGTFRLGNKSSFRTFYGMIGGAGVHLDYFNIRTSLEANYHYGLTPITSEMSNTDGELASLGDVPDELSVQQINVALSLIFPLRYIDRSLSPY